jgi:NADH-quinone oxidoreductase subunit L
MAMALVVLALGSIVAGYIGVPHALGGTNRLEAYLAPSFEVSHTAEIQEAAGDRGDEAAHGDEATELTLMAVSSAIALAGIGIAWYFFSFNPRASDAVAHRFSRLRSLLAHKYYVDELYDHGIVTPLERFSEEGLWKRFDVILIDGVVNGTCHTVRGVGAVLRRVQTGSVRVYAASFLLGTVGTVLALGYYFWP